MLYEKGVALLQRRDYAAAALRLKDVLNRYPEEGELAERARLYLRVCERELEPKARAPRTVEEHVYAATLALNAGDDTAALSLLSDARVAAPDNGHVRYMLAVVQARRGARDEALAELRRAAELDPESRVLARRDTDFEDLHEDEEFLTVTEPPHASRRRQRPRATR